MSSDSVAAIDAARYLSLTTFRRDERSVATPVWFARVEGSWFVFSAGDAGKVKRLRHTSRVTVAPCDVRGKILGTGVETSAELVPYDSVAYQALRKRYGMQMRIADWMSALTGRIRQRQLIRVGIPQ